MGLFLLVPFGAQECDFTLQFLSFPGHVGLELGSLLILGLKEGRQGHGRLLDAVEFLELELFALDGLLHAAESAGLGAQPLRNIGQELANLRLEAPDLAVDALDLDGGGDSDRFFRSFFLRPPLRGELGAALFFEVLGQGLVGIQHFLLGAFLGKPSRGCGFFSHNDLLSPGLVKSTERCQRPGGMESQIPTRPVLPAPSLRNGRPA